jgi:hypothetical protein
MYDKLKEKARSIIARASDFIETSVDDIEFDEE